MIRAMREEDLEILKKIHEEYYKDEFCFPDFTDKFLWAFISTNECGEIIVGGGVRLIAEAVFITDKRQPVRVRRDALIDSLGACSYIADKDGYDQIHAFVQESCWLEHLFKVGFEPTKGNAVVKTFLNERQS